MNRRGESNGIIQAKKHQAPTLSAGFMINDELEGNDGLSSTRCPCLSFLSGAYVPMIVSLL